MSFVRELRRGASTLVVLAFSAPGCTLTADEFEPSPVAQTETDGLSGTEPPPAPATAPAGNAPNPVGSVDDTEEVEPGITLDPTDTDEERAEGVSAGERDAGSDAGVQRADGGVRKSDAGIENADAGVRKPDAGGLNSDAGEAEPTASGPSEPGPSEPGPSPPCPGSVFAGGCYQFFAERLSWGAAEGRCVEWGGHLASVESFEEDAFLGSWPAMLGVAFGDGSGIWLGGTDAARDGDFRWSGDRPLSFVGWAPNQPDNGAGVDCVEKRNVGTGRWFDRRCVDAEPYVCERPL